MLNQVHVNSSSIEQNENAFESFVIGHSYKFIWFWYMYLILN